MYLHSFVVDVRVLLETLFLRSTFILKPGNFCTIQVFGGAHFLLCIGAEKKCYVFDIRGNSCLDRHRNKRDTHLASSCVTSIVGL